MKLAALSFEQLAASLIQPVRDNPVVFFINMSINIEGGLDVAVAKLSLYILHVKAFSVLHGRGHVMAEAVEGGFNAKLPAGPCEDRGKCGWIYVAAVFSSEYQFWVFPTLIKLLAEVLPIFIFQKNMKIAYRQGKPPGTVFCFGVGHDKLAAAIRA